MATYAELADITAAAGFGALQAKVRVAVAIKAVAILDSVAPSAPAVEWAKSALDAPASVANSVMWYVVAANAGATVTQITGAPDAAVQSNVNAAVDAIVSV